MCVFVCFKIKGVYLYRTIRKKEMTKATITKTLKKVASQPKEYSLGFKRYISLSQRVINNVRLSCILRGESNTESMKEHLNNLTEIEFINFLKLA